MLYCFIITNICCNYWLISKKNRHQLSKLRCILYSHAILFNNHKHLLQLLIDFLKKNRHI